MPEIKRPNGRTYDIRPHANLRWADLHWADLHCAHLRGADLRGADLRWANLRKADLRWADLRWANLRGADLKEADLRNAKGLTETLIVPQTGSFDAWKKCRNNVIVKLRIPAKARRSNATSRKCRAEYAKVLQVICDTVGLSSYDGVTTYAKGDLVRADSWDEDRWTECGGGIHFFITRQEAEECNL
jgi:uncharacterized protein YbdZ (MbtH family)